MEIIKFKESGYLPGIILDKEAQKFQITGRACPEDPVEFYQPVFDWLLEYSQNPLDEMIFEFKMSYYNTASSKILMMILQKLEEIAEKGNNVKIKWFYQEDDEDMLEAGEDYNEMVELDFELIPLEE
jgi:hypothetical protein